MKSVSGKIARFLYDCPDHLTGFVLDGGEKIRFWLSPADAVAVAAHVSLDARVRIHGNLNHSDAGQEYMQAAVIINLDAKRSLHVLAPVHLHKPGMPFVATPTNRASLAHLNAFATMTQAADSDARGNSGEDFPAEAQTRSHPASGRLAGIQGPACAPQPVGPASGQEGAAAIAAAFDGLNRLQAMLAYLRIVRRQMPGTSQLLLEAKRTYEQALRSYCSDDFDRARGFAVASLSLSSVVDILIARTLRRDTAYPFLVPPPPQRSFASSDYDATQGLLNQAGKLLSRIHWLLENGTLPSEDRAQVRRIASWAQTLYEQGRRTYGVGALDDVAELLQAASAAAHSAEQICRNWYVRQSNSSPVNAFRHAS